jgi:bacteriorhodopsin
MNDERKLRLITIVRFISWLLSMLLSVLMIGLLVLFGAAEMLESGIGKMLVLSIFFTVVVSIGAAVIRDKMRASLKIKARGG